MSDRKNIYPIDSKLLERVDTYLDTKLQELIDLTVKVCSIPSATGMEEKKADFILELLNKITPENVWKDEVGNVLCHIKGEIEGDVSIYTAHIDTVFGDVDEIEPVIEGNRIYAPAIGDNSVNVAALILSAKMFNELGIIPKRDLLLAFTVGEEGLGNLKGIRQVMDDWLDRTHEVIALDGGFTSIVDTAVGSKRYLIKAYTEGGHSWGAFGNSSAIAYASKVINALYDIKPPKDPKTTYNAGIIKGGRAVNVIAQDVEFIMDFRSVDRDSLSAIEEQFFTILEAYKGDEVELKVELLGERPCGEDVDRSDILRRIKKVRDYLGLDTTMRSGSTDANIPLSLGIPAITFGVYIGAKAHTLEEYIEIDSLETGMRHFLYFMLTA